MGPVNGPTPNSYEALDLAWNPYHETSHQIILTFRGNQDLKKIQKEIYSDLKRFAHFDVPYNRGGAVTVSGSVAKFRGPHWPPATTLQRIGSWLTPITGLTYYNVVNLSYYEDQFMVTAKTVPGHILEGTRSWWVQKNEKDNCSLIVATSANERTAGLMNHLGREVFSYIFGDIQVAVWEDYLTNIGKHWSRNGGVEILGPYNYK